MNRRCLWAMALMLSYVTASQAAPPPDNTNASGSTRKECPTSDSKVTDVYVGKYDKNRKVPAPDDQINTVRLGDIITVTTDNLPQLKAESDCRGAEAGQIVLFIDGRPVPRGTAYPPLSPETGTYQFELKRTEHSRELWTQILSKPSFQPREIEISVGLEKRYPIESTHRLLLDALPMMRVLIWGGLLLILIGIFWYFARKSDVLRTGGVRPMFGMRPFSLATSQAAWWFFIVMSSFMFISIVTLDFISSFSGPAVWILAIAGGTATFSAYIGSQKEDESLQSCMIAVTAIDAQIQSIDTVLQEQNKIVEAANKASQEHSKVVKAESEAKRRAGEAAKKAAEEAADFVAKIAADLAVKEVLATAAKNEAARLTEEKRKLISQRDKAARRSEGFLKDILSDANGVSFHRFQLFSWSVVLGAVFTYEVWRNLAMPQFGVEQLGLLGLSSGTYLALKIPEPTVPKTAWPAP